MTTKRRKNRRYTVRTAEGCAPWEILGKDVRWYEAVHIICAAQRAYKADPDNHWSYAEIVDATTEELEYNKHLDTQGIDITEMWQTRACIHAGG